MLILKYKHAVLKKKIKIPLLLAVEIKIFSDKSEYLVRGQPKEVVFCFVETKLAEYRSDI